MNKNKIKALGYETFHSKIREALILTTYIDGDEIEIEIPDNEGKSITGKVTLEGGKEISKFSDIEYFVELLARMERDIIQIEKWRGE